MNWDDIKLFLAVARRKKLSTAARDLKLDLTTVSRRIKRLEENLGQTLFERLRRGHILTRNGEDLFALAEQIERNFDKIRRSKLSAANTPSGTIRVSVAEGFGAELLAPVLGNFCELHPEIEIDLVSGSGFLSLSKREADVAIGLSRSKSKHIHSSFLRTYNLHLYGHENYLNRNPKIKSRQDLSTHTLIDYVDDLIYSEELRYFQEELSELQPKIRSTSIMAQKRLVEAGAGIAILPDFIASGKMNKILAQDISIERQFWFSCHQSVAQLERVKAFNNFIFLHLSNP